MSDQVDVAPLVAFGRRGWRSFVSMLETLGRNRLFGRVYVLAAVLVLVGTTTVWAILGARLQAGNADQLSDPYLFANGTTLHGATFPGAHTFLFKWPIFWLVAHGGVTHARLLTATVGVVLITVLALAYVLYRIDRRPLVFGTVCLALSLALLLIPAQPYAGGILPVNMAMLTTRNLEYILYLAALYCLMRTSRIRSKSLFVGAVLLALLIASDKLFMSLSLGGAVMALGVYALRRNWILATYMARWLVGTILAVIGATLILVLVGHGVHLANSTSANPYGLTHSPSDIVLGGVYAVLGLFTNGGANPAFSSRIASEVPGALAQGLWSPYGLAYILAAVMLVSGLILVVRFMLPTFRSADGRTTQPVANVLAVTLFWSTLAAFGVFIFTKHYYAVDARYLAIGLFALAIGASTELRRRQFKEPGHLLRTAVVLAIAIAIAVPTAVHVSSQQSAALMPLAKRNMTIAAALEHHRVDVLLGDYWRVMPIELAAKNHVTALPLSGCTQASSILTSSAWQPDLTKHSFAYLVTMDGSLTDFPSCSLSQAVSAYGRPSATQVIAGTIAHPDEVLLFYDHGRSSSKPGETVTNSSVLSTTADNLMDTSCEGPTVMNVVAHEDDDLLFLSPDLLHNIQGGDCVRTVFLTAGDAGYGSLYWLGRQAGSEHAYNSMLGHDYTWNQRTVEIAPHEYISVATPEGNTKVSLIFFNLPDGNLTGDGFSTSHFESLAKLYNRNIAAVRTVDQQSTYTSDQLVSALSTLMTLYSPDAIHTQADVVDPTYADHSDHMTTSKFVELAANQYDLTQFAGTFSVPVSRYIGYPIQGYPENVSGVDYNEKQAAFFAYAKYDSGTCYTVTACEGETYGSYLFRQYQE